jgi:hypothetical protein
VEYLGIHSENLSQNHRQAPGLKHLFKTPEGFAQPSLDSQVMHEDTLLLAWHDV